MGEQSQLNGAYYGPSVPPQRSYHSHGRGRGCGPCCFLGFLCKLIVSIVVLVGIAVLVLWLVYRPTEIKVHVVNATLREFNLTDNNNQIRYNLALDMSVRNTNRKIGVYYDRIQADAFYEGEWFAGTEIDTFFQGRKNTTMIHPVFQGTSSIRLSGSDITRFDRERSDGTFNIDVRLNLRIRFKVGDVKTRRLKPNVKCDVRVPLTPNRASVGAFDTKRCKFNF
ncbi:hypothetical protein AQUCO_00900728v1 [Aquilegia coerulea]|uniref:Late embryogenesis abundant protein LEA-2 subgroup domain-containing protein n=1 Tax=Aquilegia coerulea TaxID=218851 RepID=A0A2G5EF87_AQUCA|nr:hypothetical protein AQUCO_00900728v1 [Aquilegia coerulea]